MIRRVLAASCIIATALAAHADDAVSWQGRTATMTVDGSGHVLHLPQGERAIPAQRMAVHTASPLFDGLFDMAQDDLQRDSVAAIRDDAFDQGQSMPCTCFETGEKWHYVWTRDVSFSIDLSLWRLDPERARQSLRFKLSDVRGSAAPQGLYAMQDTGSGGSWPVSTDRIVWFLAARHLLDDRRFADDTWQALTDTLAQDRLYTFDADAGLYRGETSFLDWRQQSYPAWTAKDVRFITQSYALSTNVLHFQALQLAEELATQRHDARASRYAAQADALKAAINRVFWREDRGLYMSYVGGGDAPMPVEAYDLLGTALAITSGIAEGEQARRALADYPAWPAGSPVIWPERADQPIYHNRAIWPFVSAYELRAARTVGDAPRIAHAMESLMRGAALAGSNMENFELASQSVHVDEGTLSGPVVDSPRQLWSVAGYLDMVMRGVFGLEDDGGIAPKLPVSMMPLLFGDSDRIRLDLPGRHVTLLRPASVDGDLLVAKSRQQQGDETVVVLQAVSSHALPMRIDAPLYAPATPKAPMVREEHGRWNVDVEGPGVLYIDGRRAADIADKASMPMRAGRSCFQFVQTRADGVESLPSAEACIGNEDHVAGAWPREWKAGTAGRYRVAADYANAHGPIPTGITAAVQWLDIHCDGAPVQRVLLVLPHSDGRQRSTDGYFTVAAGAVCHFTPDRGFNMSDLDHNAHYTGGQGGADGAVNDADIGVLLLSPLFKGSIAR